MRDEKLYGVAAVILVTFLGLAEVADAQTRLGARRPATRPAPPAGLPPPGVARGANPDPDDDSPAAPTTAPVRFGPVTAAQRDAEMERVRKLGKTAGERLGMELRTLETNHFVIYTDWQPQDDGFLKQYHEEAYVNVARFYGLDPRGNVFVWKLPVFMFSKKEDFVRFAQEMDNTDAAQKGGYYHHNGPGRGHLVMFDTAGRGDARRTRWSYNLTHEFSHAFVDRYVSSIRIPKWLNEGVAEVVASRQFPQVRMTSPDKARKVAGEDRDLQSLLAQRKGFVDADLYPVCRSLVEWLDQRNRRAMLQFVTSIKDGLEPEEALKKHYGLTYAELERQWERAQAGR